MTTTLMTMVAKLGLDSGGFVAGMDKAAGTAEKGSGNIVKTLGKIAGVVASAFVIKKIVDFGEAIVNEAMDAENKLAELNAVIASTKGVSGMTADSVMDIADSLAKLTPFEDDAIVAGESMLLTFTNIGKDVFPQATEAMLNMAQKFGGIDAASIQLGKALNDPITGVTALRRVGVMLTDQQEASIKSFMAVGDIASAQAVILGELETEFGGLAKAMGQTTLGKITRFKNAIGNLKETLGTALLPTIGKIAEKFGNFLSDNMPKITAFATKVGDWIGGAFEKVWNWASKAWVEVQHFIGVFSAIFDDIVSGDIGLALDDFFEGFGDQLAAMGINTRAAGKLVHDLVTEFAWIPEGIAKIFADGKNVVSLAFKGLMGENVWEDTTSFDIGKGITVTAGLKTQMMALGQDALGFIAQGMADLGKFIILIADAFVKWAEAPETLAGAQTFGHDLGIAMGDSIGVTLESGETSDKVSKSVAIMLTKAAKAALGIGFQVTVGLTKDTGLQKWINNYQAQILANRNEAIRWFAQAATDIKTWISTAWNNVGEFLKGLGSDISTTATQTTAAVSTWFSNIKNTIKGWLTRAGADIKGWSTDAIKWVTDGAVGVWQAVTTWFGNTYKAIKDWCVNTVASVEGAGKGIWDAIMGWLSKTWTDVTGWLGKIITSFVMWQADVNNTILYWGKVFLAIITLPFVTAYVWIDDKLKAIGAAIAGWLVKTWGDISAWAAPILAAIAKPFVDAWAFVTDWAGKIWKWVTDTWATLKSTVDSKSAEVTTSITSPFTSAWNWLTDWADKIGVWVSTTWTMVIGIIAGFAVSVWTAIVGPFNTAKDTLIGWGNTIRAWVSTTWATITGIIAGFAISVWTAITGAFTSAYNTLVGWGNTAWKWASDTWTGIANTITNVATSVYNAIAQPFTDAWNYISTIPAKIIALFAGVNIPMPHFTLGWSLNDISPLFPGVKMPEASVKWYGQGLENAVFDQPTLIGVGDRGPEQVSVTPQGKQSGASPIFNLNFYGDNVKPREVKDGVQQAMRANGMA